MANNTIDAAVQHHQAGRPREAEAAYQRVLAADPGNAAAMHGLGLLAHAQGRNGVAAEWLARAAEREPSEAVYQFDLGAVRLALGETGGAVAAYRAAVALEPGWAAAHAGLGMALGRVDGAAAHGEAVAALQRAAELGSTDSEVHRRLALALRAAGQAGEAAAAARRAVVLRMDAAAGHRTLGDILNDVGDWDGAAQAFGMAVALEPDDADGRRGLGAALAAAGNFVDGEANLREAIRARPDDAAGHHALGDALYQQKKWAEAADTFREAIRCRPDFAKARLDLANVLEKQGLNDEAAAVYRAMLRDRPGAAEVEFHLAALGAATAPPPPPAAGNGDGAPAAAAERLAAAPAAYITSVFDSFAPFFDQHLTGRLRYRGPDLLLTAVSAAAPPGHRPDVLDLGCGTGLCGKAFRPLAATLTGVDLSPGMIERARETGAYDRLIVADLIMALQDHTAAGDRFDLALAADVLIYFGDLRPLFTAIAAALRPGGLFAFTVEAGDDAGHPQGYRLHATRRYTHSKAYLRDVAAAAGFAEVSLAPATLRIEREQDVGGYVVVLRAGDARPQSAAR